MDIRIIATLPRVSMGGDEVALENARCFTLPFDRLLELENRTRSAIYDGLRFKYKRNPPTFFEKWIQVPDRVLEMNASEIIHALVAHADPHYDRCALALHFSSARPMLDPRLSTIYFDYRSERNFRTVPSLEERFDTIGAYRVKGESGSEFTFQNANSDRVISEADGQAFREWYSLLESKQDMLQDECLRDLFEPLRVMALPGIDQDVQQMLLAGTLESFLIPEVRSGIAKQFIARFTAMCADMQDVEEDILRNTYKLRSAIVHGDTKERGKILRRMDLEYSVYLSELQRYIIAGLRKFLTEGMNDRTVDERLVDFRKNLDVVDRPCEMSKGV